MRRLTLLLIGLWPLACAEASEDAFERGVVSLHITQQGYDADMPWAKQTPSKWAAVAAVVDGPALLTSTQMIENATLIQAERFGDGRRWNARLLHSDPEINLALVGVDDEAFFEGLEQVEMDDALPTEGFVRSVRWKNGQLESSESRVARVEVSLSRQGNVEHVFLRVRTDVEGGGWSEPVYHGARFAGLTASQDGDQRAVIIPPEIVRSYVDRARGDDYRGFASLGVVWQTNRDEALASYLGLEGPPRGVVIRAARTGSSACGVLEPRDVLLALDGHEIDSVGNYQHPVYGRIRFTHIAVDGHQPGEVVTARVLRGEEILELPMELRTYPSEARLLPWRRDGRAPAYVVAGGFVFRELDGEYIRTWGNNWQEEAPFSLTNLFFLKAHAQGQHRRRVVVLSSVLPDAFNLGYHDVADRIVEGVNGIPIDSVSGVERAFAQPRDGFHSIRLAPNGSRLEIVLDAADFPEATRRILERYGIPAASRLGPEPEAVTGPECGGGY